LNQAENVIIEKPQLYLFFILAYIKFIFKPQFITEHSKVN